MMVEFAYFRFSAGFVLLVIIMCGLVLTLAAVSVRTSFAFVCTLFMLARVDRSCPIHPYVVLFIA